MGDRVSAVPVPPSPLIGRAGDLPGAVELSRAQRLVTLVGPGGVGKTRLAIEVASLAGSDVDLVGFVDLAVLDGPDQVLPAIARTVGLQDGGSAGLAGRVHRRLQAVRALLVLDNMEHLLPSAGSAVADLLAYCPGLRMLVTSRAPLQVPGEHLLPVEPLTLPDLRTPLGPAGLETIPAVALLVARVRAVIPDFAVSTENARPVAELSVALEGLPLAIELAAPQVRTLGLQEVLARTTNRFQLLHLPHRQVPDRHRSLAGTVHWSLNLLTPATRRVFEELSVFAGGWTVQAATAVCGPGAAEAVTDLVDQSLVQVVHTPTGTRYRMLETLRERAAADLAARGATRQTRRRHAAWAADIADEIGAGWHGPDEPGWLERAEREHPNLLAALETCHREDVDAGLRIATGLTWFWDMRGHITTARDHLDRLLGRPDGAPALRARALDSLGQVASLQSDHEAARRALAESIALSTAAGDTAAVAWSRATIAIWSLLTGQVEAAAQMAEAAVSAVGPSDHPVYGRALVALALVRWTQGRKDEAADLFDRCLASVPPGTSPWARGRALQFVGWTAHLDGDDDRALKALQDSAHLLALIRAHRSQADSLDLLGCQWERRGAARRAVRLLALAGRCRTIAGVPQHGYLERLTTPAHAAAAAVLGPDAVERITRDVAALPITDVLVADPPADAATGAAGAAGSEAPPMVVTPRERQVAALVAGGMTNRQIGHALNTSERTAERHVENLRSKLGVTSRAQIAAWAARALDLDPAP